MIFMSKNNFRRALYYGSPEKLERRNKLVASLFKLFAVLLGYYIFVRLTGLAIPCLFHEITGLKCPGCGITHMMLNIAQLRFKDAFFCNPLMFVLFPMICAGLCAKLLFMPEWLEIHSKVYRTIEIILLSAVMIFGIVRNIVHI